VLPNHDDAYPAIVRSAYESWCAAAGQDPIIASFDPDTTETAEDSAIATLLRLSPRPDAVFGVYNRSGCLILGAARELGNTCQPRGPRVVAEKPDASMTSGDMTDQYPPLFFS